MSAYPHVLTEARTLSLAAGGRSLARFGDGELKLMLGRSACAQAADARLASLLKRVLMVGDGACLPCIPNIGSALGNPPGASAQAAGRMAGASATQNITPKAAFWAQYAEPRYTRFYTAGGPYGSSFVTRPDSAPWIDSEGWWKDVEALWRGKRVVLVRGSGKSLTPADMDTAAHVQEIIAPAQHAFAKYDELVETLKGEKRRVILCLGPTATVLAWTLANLGTQALDLGHIGMFRRRADRERKGLAGDGGLATPQGAQAAGRMAGDSATKNADREPATEIVQ